jgi:hypothetical protein
MIGKTNRLLSVPKMHEWLQTDENGNIDVARTNDYLREEFENIGGGMNDTADSISEVRTIVVGDAPVGPGGRIIAPVDPGGGTGGGTGGGDPIVDTDELVKVTPADVAGYLTDKIKGSPGIRVELQPVGGGGQALVLVIDAQLELTAFNFKGKEVTIYHPFGNYFYSFQLDKPMEDGGLAPVPFQTYRKYPYRLWIRLLADDDYGFATIIGRRGAVSAG